MRGSDSKAVLPVASRSASSRRDQIPARNLEEVEVSAARVDGPAMWALRLAVRAKSRPQSLIPTHCGCCASATTLRATLRDKEDDEGYRQKQDRHPVVALRRVIDDRDLDADKQCESRVDDGPNSVPAAHFGRLPSYLVLQLRCSALRVGVLRRIWRALPTLR